MKLSVLSNLYRYLSLEDTLKRFKELGVEAIEIGCGGYPGKDHADPAVLLADDKKCDEFKALLAKYDIKLAALSAHGNMLHPNKEIAAKFDADLRNAILLAEKLGIDTVVTFSGCPGDCETAKYPNWVTCPWPEDFLAILDWQWNEKIIPYWKEIAKFALDHNVPRIAFEMHPGFAVYNPETLMKLRAAVGPVIGANLDPSHLVWQGIEPAAAIRYLGDAIYHVHAKDTKIDPINTARIGVLDTKHYSDEINRAWVFRAIGYGHDEAWWRDFISNLRLVGYDRVLSIEHEDSLMTIDEGLEKAVAFLKRSMISEPKPGTMAWA